MNGLVQYLNTAFDFLLVAVGFGLIIFLHELGHFLAARWAGIRVMAFAIGFGPAVVSFRKGMGFRRGSTEGQYFALAKRRGEEKRTPLRSDFANATTLVPELSPTEYRFNALPFGGYVKMLGQVDGDASATSDAADSYQNARIWKRMVVISAGVVANLITAAGLFLVVFYFGIRMEPAKIGVVAPGSPAMKAIGSGGAADVGLEPGDEILGINGRSPNSFNDLMLAVAMTSPGESLTLDVRRDGTDRTYRVTPEKSPSSGLLDIGVGIPFSLRIPSKVPPESAARLADTMKGIGIEGVEPGMTLSHANGQPLENHGELEQIFRDCGGEPVEITFVSPDGRTVRGAVQARAALQKGYVAAGKGDAFELEHLLGLTGVMKVQDASPDGAGPKAHDQGLRDGDIFVRLGAVEYPSILQGRLEIQANKGKTIPIVVRRSSPGGGSEDVSLPNVKVSSKGTIGFKIADTLDDSTRVALPPATLASDPRLSDSAPTAAARLLKFPGAVISAVNGTSVATITQVREAIRKAIAESASSVEITLQRPGIEGSSTPETVAWPLDAADIAAVRELEWEPPAALAAFFEPEQTLVKGKSPLDALAKGVEETHRVMLSTYVTFARLFQGSVKVEHLKGPVGIAHMGTLIAGRGFIWLLFFLALISVNLAVINFLPLPIVDGGQFLFLLYEQFRGRPAPIAVQNVLTLAGLVLIAGVFLIVTFNDVKNLLGL